MLQITQLMLPQELHTRRSIKHSKFILSSIGAFDKTLYFLSVLNAVIISSSPNAELDFSCHSISTRCFHSTARSGVSVTRCSLFSSLRVRRTSRAKEHGLYLRPWGRGFLPAGGWLVSGPRVRCSDLAQAGASGRRLGVTYQRHRLPDV